MKDTIHGLLPNFLTSSFIGHKKQSGYDEGNGLKKLSNYDKGAGNSDVNQNLNVMNNNVPNPYQFYFGGVPGMAPGQPWNGYTADYFGDFNYGELPEFYYPNDVYDYQDIGLSTRTAPNSVSNSVE